MCHELLALRGERIVKVVPHIVEPSDEGLQVGSEGSQGVANRFPRGLVQFLEALPRLRILPVIQVTADVDKTRLRACLRASAPPMRG